MNILPGGKNGPTKLDFRPFTDLAEGGTISGMTFDPSGHIFVVGFRNATGLALFELTDGNAKAVPLPAFPRPVRGWAHGSRGELAIVTTQEVFVHQLAHASNGDQLGSISPNDQVRLPVRNNALDQLTCVALSPKGSILATGDESGVVAIRPLAKPIEGRVVLRLSHVGPIQRLVFSPDGRVLAALASRAEGKDDSLKEVTTEEKSKVRPGVIRLWVTDGWERGEDASGISTVTKPTD